MDNKTQIIELLDGLSKRERTSFIWELIEKYDIQIFPGDGDEEEEIEEKFSVTLIEIPESKRKEFYGFLRKYFPISEIGIQKLYNKMKDLPWTFLEEVDENDANQICNDIESAGGKCKIIKKG